MPFFEKLFVMLAFMSAFSEHPQSLRDTDPTTVCPVLRVWSCGGQDAEIRSTAWRAYLSVCSVPAASQL